MGNAAGTAPALPARSSRTATSKAAIPAHARRACGRQPSRPPPGPGSLPRIFPFVVFGRSLGSLAPGRRTSEKDVIHPNRTGGEKLVEQTAYLQTVTTAIRKPRLR